MEHDAVWNEDGAEAEGADEYCQVSDTEREGEHEE